MSTGILQGAYVEKGLMCRTAAYHQQYRRPIKANFGQNISQLAEITMGGDFSKERLAPIAATSLTLSSQVEREADIVGGWNNERCLFALKIVHQSNHANTMRYVQYLMGYTDHMGIHAGHNGIIGGANSHMPIDPNMRLYFNSSLVFQELTTMSPHGYPQVNVTPVEATQLLMGNPGTMAGDSSYTLRPEDVYSMIHGHELVQSVQRYQTHAGQGDAAVNMYDSRVMFQPGQPLKKSSRSNLIPSNYLSKIISNPANVLQSYYGEQIPTQDLANKFSASLSEGYLGNDHTLGKMLERTGLAENRSITYHELCMLLPNADSVITRLGVESKQVQGACGMQSHYMNGAEWELIIAQTLQNVVAALMMETSMSMIMITGDNYQRTDIAANQIGGHFKVMVPYGQSFIDGRPVEVSCEQIRHRLVSEFLIGFTGHSYMPIGFSIKLDMYGECVVDISYNGQPAVRFVTPMFGDSLFSPMLTNQRSTLAELSKETRAVTHNLLNAL